MVDSVVAQRAQVASGVGGPDRARGRGPVEPARATSPVGQRAFGASFAEASAALHQTANDRPKVGGGLLSTSVQIMLAETRSQEAAAPFVAPSKLGQALNIYAETQGQVRDTIRANLGGKIDPSSTLASRIKETPQINETPQHAGSLPPTGGLNQTESDFPGLSGASLQSQIHAGGLPQATIVDSSIDDMDFLADADSPI